MPGPVNGCCKRGVKHFAAEGEGHEVLLERPVLVGSGPPCQQNMECKCSAISIPTTRQGGFLGWGKAGMRWNWAEGGRAGEKMRSRRGTGMVADAATKSYIPSWAIGSDIGLLGSGRAKELAQIQATTNALHRGWRKSQWRVWEKAEHCAEIVFSNN